jgi:predicted PurR-regulated permease PerM
MESPASSRKSFTNEAIEIAIRLALLFLILTWCLQIVSPFISLVAWGGIIAVAIYSPYLKLVNRLGGRKKLAVALIATIGIGVILVPVVSLSGSLIDGATRLGSQISSGQMHVPPPSESVSEWPLIGEKIYPVWKQASENLGASLRQYPEQLTVVGKKLLSLAAGVGAGVLQFVVSTLMAAVFLLNAESVNQGLKKLVNRLTAEKGDELLALTAATIRSVAVGVIGIAFIQAMLGGIGMLFVVVPAAGLLAILILVLAIAQLPPILILGPVAVYVFSVESTMVAVLFLAWAIIVSASDMVLKPLMLGRGVNVPMLVILLGAIGGMITTGIVGLFIGAVILGVGYTLIIAWVGRIEPPAALQEDAAADP